MIIKSNQSYRFYPNSFGLIKIGLNLFKLLKKCLKSTIKILWVSNVSFMKIKY